LNNANPRPRCQAGLGCELAKSIEGEIAFFTTEVIRRTGPWRHLDAVEFATLDRFDWFNTRRLLEPIGYMPPAEHKARY
jgi:transposase InsO family protein